ncbi:hypothetical protein SPHINGOAX6_40074 [Sphingomonas sp. AX6]|nr:hypothetical protein SPHINGOAX6_40074 [Sphingomonas sp. AX6]
MRCQHGIPFVTPDLFRGPPDGRLCGRMAEAAQAAWWTPEQVRGDEVGFGCWPEPQCWHALKALAWTVNAPPSSFPRRQ